MSSFRICRLLVRNANNSFRKSKNGAQTCPPVLCRPDKAYHSVVSRTYPEFFSSNKKLPSSFSICTSSSLLAKGKDRGKEKKKVKGGKKVSINENLLSQLTNLDSLKGDLQESIDLLKDDFVKHLSLRSATGAIESLKVKVDGDEYLIQDLAQINRKNPKTVIMSMSSFPQAIPAVLEALQKSGMDLNPQQDGTKLFIPVPKVTKEHREQLSKNAKALFIKYRDRIKDIQNKHHKKIRNKENEGGVSKDEIHEALDMVTQMAQIHIDTAEKILATKQQELVQAG